MKLVFGSLLAAVPMAAAADYAAIAGFKPLTDVRDQNRIDMDMEKIMEEYEGGDVDVAKNIYTQGAFSKTISELTLSAGLPSAVAKGTLFMGPGSTSSTQKQESVEGDVQVFAYADTEAGATTLTVQYVDENCYVGANPDPITTGCLAPSGSLKSINSNTTMTLDYSYDVLADTKNAYNIQKFTQASEYSFDGSAITADFKKYIDFYGSDSFNDDIVQAIFSESKTKYPSGFNFDFSSVGMEARAEVLETALGYLAVRNYVLRELEHAIYLCETGDCAENSCVGMPAVHEVDEAVAFYVGSLEGVDGSGEGVLVYDMANNRAEEFGTASNGLAKANQGIMDAFVAASEAIVGADCQGTRDATTTVAQKMAIPLVQNLLKYTYITTKEGSTEKQAGERVAAAFNVLPLVAACSADDAKTIYDDTNFGVTPDFDAVKTAVSNNYDCMGISADDIGTPPEVDDSADEEEPAAGGAESEGEAAAPTSTGTSSSGGSPSSGGSSSTSGSGSSSSSSSSSTSSATVQAAFSASAIMAALVAAIAL